MKPLTITTVIDVEKLTETVNAKLDIPYIPEAVEARLFKEGVEAGTRAVAELLSQVGNEYVTITVA